MLSDFLTRRSLILVLFLLLSGCSTVLDKGDRVVVECEVSSIELDADQPFLALPGTHDLRGRAHVRCTNAGRQFRLISVGLVDGADSPVHTLQGREAAAAAATLLLYADAQRRVPMPYGTMAVPAAKHDLRLAAGTTAELTLPFYARMVVSHVLPAGSMSQASTLRARVLEER